MAEITTVKVWNPKQPGKTVLVNEQDVVPGGWVPATQECPFLEKKAAPEKDAAEHGKKK